MPCPVSLLRCWDCALLPNGDFFFSHLVGSCGCVRTDYRGSRWFLLADRGAFGADPSVIPVISSANLMMGVSSAAWQIGRESLSSSPGGVCRHQAGTGTVEKKCLLLLLLNTDTYARRCSSGERSYRQVRWHACLELQAVSLMKHCHFNPIPV
jgi:hypothetical protein